MTDSGIRFPLDSDCTITRYQHALGGFINDFALMETFLGETLVAASGVSKKVGQALFNGLRLKDMIGKLRGCYAANDLPIPPYLERALHQAMTLNTLRNQVAHYVTFESEDEDRVWASNVFRYPFAKSTEIMVAPDELYAASGDARVLVAFFTTAASDILEPGVLDTIIAEMEEKQPAWRYKSPPQGARPR